VARHGICFGLACSAITTTPRRTSMHAQAIIGSHPHVRGNVNGPLIQCIEECYDCAQACAACADACLGEDSVATLTQCIRLNLDCADLCTAAGSVASRRTGSNEAVLVATLDACSRCANACDDAVSSIQRTSH
jgi:hypothetical protein